MKRRINVGNLHMTQNNFLQQSSFLRAYRTDIV